jgi:hypothetical protein
VTDDELQEQAMGGDEKVMVMVLSVPTAILRGERRWQEQRGEEQAGAEGRAAGRSRGERSRQEQRGEQQAGAEGRRAE